MTRGLADHDRRMQALDEFLDAYEAEHGEITEEELRDATRRTRARATLLDPDPHGDRLPQDGPPTTRR